MLVVLRTNPVNDAVRLEQVLLAQQHVGLLVGVIGADDLVTSRGNQSHAPRDNVIFELGLCMGDLSRSRTFILAPKGIKVRIPSDLFGLTLLEFDPPPAKPGDAVGAAVTDLADIITKNGPR